MPLTPIRALYRAVDLYGKKTGVVCGDRRFTYAEFGERVERLAFGLLSEGVLPGDRVAFLSFNTHQLLEGYFAAPLVRAIVMPLNVRLTAAELTGILNHAEPRVLIYEADFAPLVEQLRQACPCVQTLGRIRRALRGTARARAHPAARFLHLRRTRNRRAVLHLRLHRHAEGRHALAPHALPAHARPSRPPSTTTRPWSSCTPSRSSTPTAGAARSAPPFTASSR